MSHKLLTTVLLSNFLLVSLIADNTPVKKDYRRKGAMLKVYKQEKPALSKQPEKQKELEEVKQEEEKEMGEEREVREEAPLAPSMEGYGKKIKNEALEEQRARLKKAETREKKTQFEETGVKADIQKGRDDIAHFKLKKTETIKREKIGSPEAEALKKVAEKFEQPESEGDSTNQTTDDWE